MPNKNLIILFGGRSVEHEISKRSATNVFKYIDFDNYIIVGVILVCPYYEGYATDVEPLI